MFISVYESKWMNVLNKTVLQYAKTYILFKFFVNLKYYKYFFNYGSNIIDEYFGGLKKGILIEVELT